MAPINKKNLLIFHLTPFFSPNIGGVETYLDDLTSITSKNHLSQIIVTYSPLTSIVKAPFYWTSADKIQQIYRFPHIGFNLFHKLEKYPLLNFIYLTPYLLVASIIISFFHRKEHNIIHAHGLNSAIVGYVLKLIFKWPLIVNIYSTYDNVNFNSLFYKTIRFILNKSDKVLTQSNQSIEQLIQWGVNPKIIGRYYHWIDLSRFQPVSSPKSPQNFLFIGRLIPQKGVRIVLKLARIFPQINFLIVGSGPDYQKAIKLSKTLKNLKLFGEVPYKKLHQYYQMADVFIFPSLYAEGWGRTAMEAVACGLPVLGSNQGAIPENLNSSVSILFKPTLQNFQRQIAKILKSPKVYFKLQKNCRSYALKHFSTKNFSNLKKIYLSIPEP